MRDSGPVILDRKSEERGRTSLDSKIVAEYFLISDHPFFFRMITRINTTTTPAVAPITKTIGAPVSAVPVDVCVDVEVVVVVVEVSVVPVVVVEVVVVVCGITVTMLSVVLL